MSPHADCKTNKCVESVKAKAQSMQLALLAMYCVRLGVREDAGGLVDNLANCEWQSTIQTHCLSPDERKRRRGPLCM